MIEFNQSWLPFIYLYGVGGIILIVGIRIILKTNALNLSIPRHKIWLIILFFGFVFYCLLHFIFILLALGSK
ncbi:MAG: hypothetical protein CMG75_00365 [Candidatus Marinimicrobia bacterium]|nr:hypothetical protein [Candidatus Neomarinimicrobiota bacterium]